MTPKLSRLSDIHHLWWPGNDYTTKIEREFRNLPCNKVAIDRWAHRLLHTHCQPPKKPLRTEMLYVIHQHSDRACSCFEPIIRRKGW